MSEMGYQQRLCLVINVLRGLYKATAENVDSVARSCGLTFSQYLVLSLLHSGNGCTMSELSFRGRWHLSTTLGIVQRMESANLVKQFQDQKDGRVTRVYITPYGEQKRQEMISATTESSSLKDILASFDQGEFIKVRDTLTNVCREVTCDGYVDFLLEMADGTY